MTPKSRTTFQELDSPERAEHDMGGNALTYSEDPGRKAAAITHLHLHRDDIIRDNAGIVQLASEYGLTVSEIVEHGGVDTATVNSILRGV